MAHSAIFGPRELVKNADEIAPTGSRTFTEVTAAHPA